nr:unnamed protein product [Callosobruchus chinensis]
MRYDKGRKAVVSYEVGDLVLWRNAATLWAGGGHSHKLANKFDGPCRVSRCIGNDRYVIQATNGVKGYMRFNVLVAVDSLRRYHDVTFLGMFDAFKESNFEENSSQYACKDEGRDSSHDRSSTQSFCKSIFANIMHGAKSPKGSKMDATFERIVRFVTFSEKHFEEVTL